MLAHFSRPVVDSAGNIQSSAIVRLLQPGTNPGDGLTIATPFYSDSDGLHALSNPNTFTGGLIDFFVDTPQFVLLGVKVGAGAEQFYDWVAVNSPVQGYWNNPSVESHIEGPVLVVDDPSGAQTWLSLFSPSGSRWLLSIDDTGTIHVQSA